MITPGELTTLQSSVLSTNVGPSLNNDVAAGTNAARCPVASIRSTTNPRCSLWTAKFTAVSTGMGAREVTQPASKLSVRRRQVVSSIPSADDPSDLGQSIYGDMAHSSATDCKGNLSRSCNGTLRSPTGNEHLGAL